MTHCLTISGDYHNHFGFIRSLIESKEEFKIVFLPNLEAIGAYTGLKYPRYSQQTLAAIADAACTEAAPLDGIGFAVSFEEHNNNLNIFLSYYKPDGFEVVMHSLIRDNSLAYYIEEIILGSLEKSIGEFYDNNTSETI